MPINVIPLIKGYGGISNAFDEYMAKWRRDPRHKPNEWMKRGDSSSLTQRYAAQSWHEFLRACHPNDGVKNIFREYSIRVESGGRDSRTITKGTEHIQSERTCLFSGDKRVRLRMADWSESKCSARLYSSQSTVFKWRMKAVCGTALFLWE